MPDTVAKFQQLVRVDIHRTIADEIRIGYGTCQWIVTAELGIYLVAAKFVPRILAADQKHQRVNICKELRQIASNDTTFLSRVIAGDKSWIYGYDRDKATILPMEKPKLTETEKGETGEEQSREHAHHFP
jgi:hypothetical protein